VLDREGLDWWELTSLLIHAELETVLALQRLAPTFSSSGEIFTTRRGWTIAALEILLNRKITTVPGAGRIKLAGRVGRYRALWRRFSLQQLTEIFLDKHDTDLRWRAKLNVRRRRSGEPFVLVPSAYTNVSRMAAAYARLAPEVLFLLVYTRGSGRQLVRPDNMSLTSLAAYAGGPRSSSEHATVQREWQVLKADLEHVPEIKLLARLGTLGPFTKWLSDGLAIRDAWIEVFRREPVQAVLCGDDSNWYTRLPVLLARKRGLPTIDFHHGALDGRFLLKDLASDIYLAKSEMELDYLTRVCAISKERIVIGGPSRLDPPVAGHNERERGGSIVFFSEPYEAAGGRPEDLYGELLPPLAALAANYGKSLVVKLHPFESASDRKALVQQVLPADLQKAVRVRSGPLEERLLNETWFGVTVESTTVIECAQRGIPCFIAGWLATSLFGYVQQYAAFGLGQILQSADQLADLPGLLARQSEAQASEGGLWQPIDRGKFRWLLTGGHRSQLPQPEPAHIHES
jgi:hypothetical protein